MKTFESKWKTKITIIMDPDTSVYLRVYFYSLFCTVIVIITITT